ncbi:hypothetical protein J4E85_003331 [Alternaria conjuncta]|uniref:uncharacterized protein n=1 Tax=Alternaria conjuncta TaxID=181017 RepID=UPI002220D088|nr:uncharacterized protein J4E85_003331 [Alternaria conjuncta]KAI4932928.1 hypothetical protein J4E85_003331 [Alternaria conjuncta]
MAKQEYKFPAFDDLPKVEGMPQGSIWGFFDKDGQKDEVGTINLLTSDVVKAASKEITTGEHIQLDWELHNVQFPGFNRKELEQKQIDFADFSEFCANDDELHINTQAGSQWDSLKHFAHQASGMYYNGLSHKEAANSVTNGTHKWCERGGIVGRGVLCDWLSWYEEKNGKKAPSAVSRHEIPIEEIEETLKWQGTTLKQGDIMMIRSGYVRWHNNANEAERKSGTRDNSVAIGLQANEKTVRWLYDRHLAAIAGDTVAFEAWPPKFTDGWCLHEWLLVHWGTAIGEMWDLEKLSHRCKEMGRYTFFMTSAPLHVRGGIGSPPGVIAIF